MKIAAMTMVYRDYWALSQWYAHYASQLGAANLYVIAHGEDPKIAAICPGSKVITVSRGDLDSFDRARNEALDGFQAALLKVYDWVLRTDSDELICWDPQQYSGLVDVVQQHARWPVLTALGLQLVALDDTIDPIPFRNVRDVEFSGHYSKAVATSIPIPFALHGVRVDAEQIDDFPFHIPTGLYLVHLKFANRAALADTNKVRSDVANSQGTQMPGAAWREAEDHTKAYFEAFARKKKLRWHVAEKRAYALLSDAKHLENRMVVKARSVTFKKRTVLPDWFDMFTAQPTPTERA